MLDFFDDYIKKIEPNSCCFTEDLYEVPHIHSDFELIFCIKGEAEAFINNDKYILHEGNGVFVFPNQMHLYKTVKNGEFCVVVFKPEVIPLLSNKLLSCTIKKHLFNYDNCETIVKLINDIRDNYDVGIDNSALQLTGYINFLLFYIYPKLELQTLSYGEVELLEQIKEYCHANFKEDISVSNLSKQLLTNANRVSNIFNKNMKMGIPQYVEFLRLSEAYHLLETTNYAISKISGEVGFGSIRSMNRAFMRFFNMTPSEIKASFKGNG